MDGDPVSLRRGAVGIRPYRNDDAPALAAAVQASLDDLRRWLPWAHESYGTEDARSWIEDRERAWGEGEAYSFAIVRPDETTSGETDEAPAAEPSEKAWFLGGVGINRIDRQNRVGNVGYWVRTGARGQGAGGGNDGGSARGPFWIQTSGASAS